MITNRDIDWVRTDELYHHGIKGQKWGVRRYQNSDFDDFDGDWTKIASDIGYNYKGSSRVKRRR